MITKADKLVTDAKELLIEDNRQFQRNQVKAQKERDAETFRPDAGRDRTDQAAQFGNPMRAFEIQKRLHKMIPGLRFEVSIARPSSTGLYKGENYITAMETGISPEFSVMSEAGSHAREMMRGWRTVLANLIRGGYITVTAAENNFPIFKGHASERWWEATGR